MIRREFLKVLGGLPFLDFLKVKTEDELDIEDSLESLKEKRGISLENFTETLNTNTTYYWLSCSLNDELNGEQKCL